MELRSLDAVTVGVGPSTPLRSLEPGVRGEIPSPCTARDSLEAMRIAVAAGRSRAEHRPVRLADIQARCTRRR